MMLWGATILANQGNILSYDEVKKADRSRPSISSSKSSSAKPKRRTSANSSTSTAKQTSRIKSSSTRPSTKTTKQRGVPTKASSQTKASTTSSISQVRSVRNSSVSKNPTKPRNLVEDQARPKTPPSKDPSRFAQIKKERNRKKVDKSFSKQVKETSPSSASSGSRAAVYKGEMGRTHKRSTALQSKGSSSKRSTNIVALLGSAFSARKSPKTAVPAMLVACLVLSIVLLYPAAQQYYTAIRQNEQIKSEYSAILQRNENIEGQIHQLTTAEGIEDKARAELGWVKQGDQSVTVFGLNTVKNSKQGYVESIPTGSVESPQSWYSPALDLIFGYK